MRMILPELCNHTTNKSTKQKKAVTIVCNSSRGVVGFLFVWFFFSSSSSSWLFGCSRSSTALGVVNAETDTDNPNRHKKKNSQSNNHHYHQHPYSSSYGVDVSWPIHHVTPDFASATTNTTSSSSSRLYQHFLQGCKQYYSSESCARSEDERLFRNRNYWKTTTTTTTTTTNHNHHRHHHHHGLLLLRNYTAAGYAVLPIPKSTFTLLHDLVWKPHYDDYYSQPHHRPKFRSHDDEELKRTNTTTNTPQSLQSSQSQSQPLREPWNEGNSYTNHWSVPTRIVPLEARLSVAQRRSIVVSVQHALEQWTVSSSFSSLSSSLQQRPLTPTSLYGMRIYERGALLAPHVDRWPLILSAILNVAQQVDDHHHWPLEVYGHDGIAVNVTIQPGEMILYESATVIHGRPFPLQGDYYANVFVHFAPKQWLLQHYELQQQQQKPPPHDLYEQALAQHAQRQQQQKQQAAQSTSTSASRRDASLSSSSSSSSFSTSASSSTSSSTLYQERWNQDFVFIRYSPPTTATATAQVTTTTAETATLTTTTTTTRNEEEEEEGDGAVVMDTTTESTTISMAHIMAANGNLKLFKDVVETKKKLYHDEDPVDIAADPARLFAVDVNGWRPLHEAARAGRTDVVEYILQQTHAIRKKQQQQQPPQTTTTTTTAPPMMNIKIPDINERTNHGRGANALWWAQQTLPPQHPVLALLQAHGAIALAPLE